MALDRQATAALALHRFGFGPRAGSLKAIATDPRGALLAELDKPGAGQINGQGLPTSAEAARAIFDFQAERRAAEARDKRRQENQGAAATPPVTAPAPMAEPPPGPALPQKLFQQEVRARTDAVLASETGFVERLVWFWSNHFCVSVDKTQGRSGGYEREVIRPHVLGRFADMLQTSALHPAMLLYLDNAQSIGPNSVAGINRGRGLNENLAREILELHTLGVDGGYTQDDVTNFAKVLTGWTILPIDSDPDRGGEVTFIKRRHEPDAKMILGRSYPEAGGDEARAVLPDLARHPNTARHVARKLARHFVSDTPPDALVQRLAKRFRDSDGNLKEVAKALVTAPEAWDEKRSKIKKPAEWAMAILRSTGLQPEVPRIVQSQQLLGEPLWRPPSPKGFPDDAAAWMDGLAQRLDIANAFGRRVGERLEPAALLDTALGSLASADTRQAVARAESRQQAITLALMAPEFLRR
ncbi:hypothetical protein GJW-30_1_01473 [Variibacter gotjawalensis]|uniref:DUF1800 domain-containing protein n=1 Tax=Variibacter gotjawalensis TaxID=1333996 RepID=A0A0S3PSL3_9BRAD|nr:DUF1800 family protein [Variibacter gotjawalensis]NIK49258.1 uncharacterized protein (DUF1800 family) [Variibacter gotjawalensis]RZS51110.1 uncharacterized protein (DUF1800 family) [Variibacter gotjawalensis]BAT58945.1 hypothetical protein GJW-30_1_01473 [Variibacter gotjawalensis]